MRSRMEHGSYPADISTQFDVMLFAFFSKPPVKTLATNAETAVKSVFKWKKRPLLSVVRFQSSVNLADRNPQLMAQPKLIVFDLDYTLWPFWVDTHVDPPFHKASNGKVYDRRQQEVKHYPDVPTILTQLYNKGFPLAIASRTGALQEANDLTRLFVWDHLFQYRQIFPGSKITHFKKLKSQSGFDYKDMLFYDDEHRNIVDVSSLGVTCMFVPDGVNQQSFQEGIELFQKNRRSGE